MAFLKTVRGAGCRGGCADIEDYLLHGGKGESMQRYLTDGHDGEKPDRCLTCATSVVLAAKLGDRDARSGWAKVMDRTRRVWGKDGPEHRSYYHFVISPDPEDRCDADETLAVAVEWAEECYPDGEWFVAVHDDNEHHIPHAHIVLNAVLPKNGRMVHRTNDDVVHEARVVQAICAEHGLEQLPDIVEWRRAKRDGTIPGRTVQDRCVGTAERAMGRTGRRSWVGEIRDAVDLSVAAADSWDEFDEVLYAQGFSYHENRRGITFVHPESTGHDKRVRGANLGLAYTRDGIDARLGVDFDGVTGAGGTTVAPERPFSPHPGARPIPRELLRRHGIRTGRQHRPRTLEDWVTMRESASRNVRDIHDILQTIGTIRTEGIKTRSQLSDRVEDVALELERCDRKAADYDRAADRAGAIHKRAASAEASRRRLAAMSEGPLWPSVRKERNELMRSVDEDEAWCDDRLASAQGFLGSIGCTDAPRSMQAQKLEVELMHQANDLREEVIRLADRLAALQAAQDRVVALTPTAPRPAGGRPLGVLNTEPKVPPKNPRLHQGIMVKGAREGDYVVLDASMTYAPTLAGKAGGLHHMEHQSALADERRARLAEDIAPANAVARQQQTNIKPCTGRGKRR